ncbi:hypothetical protein BaRGS_00037665 [Batillaria attramentaria]|uniref:Uncharacterized protein n=1 Tax=Batillaria attramentaria TaxID=370345 RepID=A0ABD0J914_9CAEN
MGLTWRCFCPDGTNTEFIPTEPDAVVDFAEYATDNCPDLMEVSEVKQVFLDMLDQDSDDVIFLVKKYGKSRFVRRQLVDSDGVSNPYTVDSPQQLAK